MDAGDRTGYMMAASPCSREDVAITNSTNAILATNINKGGSSRNNSSSVVPPGFRFHPTDEELLYYYLRKKVRYEAIDLDVIREVDLNKLEPWDLKDKCRIGCGPQNEWYFFSHKDKKYPTGSRTNRATAAGFWKATGRDKPITTSTSSKRIGMRKTLVFYIGRAPHGQKTDWIMHEYRLQDDRHENIHINANIHHQEDGWVVCRVFKKKSNTTTTTSNSSSARIFQQQAAHHLQDYDEELLDDDHDHQEQEDAVMKLPPPTIMESLKQNPHHLCHQPYYSANNSSSALVEGNDIHQMHLPQLLSPESMTTSMSHVSGHPSSFLSSAGDDIHFYCSQHLLTSSTTSSSASTSFGSSSGRAGVGAENPKGEDKLMVMNGGSRSKNNWSFLEKLLLASNYQSFDDHQEAALPPPPPPHLHLPHQPLPSADQTIPFTPFHHYSDPARFFNFSK